LSASIETGSLELLPGSSGEAAVVLFAVAAALGVASIDVTTSAQMNLMAGSP